jgi:hypothetical protein
MLPAYLSIALASSISLNVIAMFTIIALRAYICASCVELCHGVIVRNRRQAESSSPAP